MFENNNLGVYLLVGERPGWQVTAKQVAIGSAVFPPLIRQGAISEGLFHGGGKRRIRWRGRRRWRCGCAHASGGLVIELPGPLVPHDAAEGVTQ